MHGRLPVHWAFFLWLTGFCLAHATPANKSALEKYYERFLHQNLARCTTCHLPSDNLAPETLDDFPHNPFGARLRAVARSGGKKQIASRLRALAAEDSDSDGIENELELLLGHQPGDPTDRPSAAELGQATARQAEFAEFLAAYRWQPLEPVQRPQAPPMTSWARNPIDAFIAAEHHRRNLQPRPEAPKNILVRRLYLDLIGLSPTPAQQLEFLQNTAPDAYEQLVDRLLQNPQYGERWARHWMDIWRYSDWAGWSGGNQIRDSQPHIWRWRDWIVEALNQDKPYDQMILEMLAADELFPEDPQRLRATGFLVRNYKMLSREQWLEDTIKHTAQAFLGITLGCAKCHDHMTDPISQTEYYQFRAIFEPHQVRTDRLPGQLDTAKDGLARVFDTATNQVTFFFLRGDERRPDTNRVVHPAVPAALGGEFRIEPVNLPASAAFPDKRPFVIRDTIEASETAATQAQQTLAKLEANPDADPDWLHEARLTAALAEKKHQALLAVLRAEPLTPESPPWTDAAQETVAAQRQVTVLEAKLAQHRARLAEIKAQRELDELPPPQGRDSGENHGEHPETAARNQREYLQCRVQNDEPTSGSWRPER